MSDSHFEQTVHYQGRYIQVLQASQTAANGKAIVRDLVLHPGAVAILPFIDDEHICLVQNHRLSAGGPLWEIPAGTLEKGEALELAAQRELAEETGYSAQYWEKLIEFYPSPGILSEVTHVFLAKNLTPGTMQLEDDEHLEPFTISWKQALQMALDGRIRDGKTILALLLWERRRQEN